MVNKDSLIVSFLGASVKWASHHSIALLNAYIEIHKQDQVLPLKLTRGRETNEQKPQSRVQCWNKDSTACCEAGRGGEGMQRGEGTKDQWGEHLGRAWKKQRRGRRVCGTEGSVCATRGLSIECSWERQGGRGRAQTSVSIHGAWSFCLGQSRGSRSPHWSHHITQMPHSTAGIHEQFSTKCGSEEINILQNLLFLRKIEGENKLWTTNQTCKGWSSHHGEGYPCMRQKRILRVWKKTLVFPLPLCNSKTSGRRTTPELLAAHPSLSKGGSPNLPSMLLPDVASSKKPSWICPRLEAITQSP